jgi:hypothetical protein
VNLQADDDFWTTIKEAPRKNSPTNPEWTIAKLGKTSTGDDGTIIHWDLQSHRRSRFLAVLPKIPSRRKTPVQIGLNLIQQRLKIPLDLHIGVLTEARQVLLRPIPSLHGLFEELASIIERCLECERAFALEDMNRVVGNSFRFGLGLVSPRS